MSTGTSEKMMNVCEGLADKLALLTDEEFAEVIRRVRAALNPQCHSQSEIDDCQVL